MNERFTKPDYLFIKPHFIVVIINCMLPSKGLYRQRTLCGWLGLLLFLALGTLPASAKSDQLVQPKNQGNVDSFVVDGNQFIAQGWAGSSKPNDKVVSLSIWLADTLVYEGGFEQFDRPDVAEATGRNDWLKSGWRVSAALPDNIKAGKYSLKVLARLDSGMEANLSIQSEAVSVNINNYHISHFVKGVVFVLTLLALLYILLIVAKLFPSFELPKKLLDLPTPSKLKGENWINRIFFFAVILAGGKFLLMKFTTFTNINFLAIILATISSFAFARGTYCKNSSFVTHGDKRKSILLIVVIFFYLGWIYSNRFVLPPVVADPGGGTTGGV